MNEPVFALLYAALKQAKCEMIAGQRCFVVERDAFFKVFGYIFDSGRDISQHPRIGAEGYENVEVTMSAMDSYRYWLCTKMEKPFITDIWEKKAPQLVEKQ